MSDWPDWLKALALIGVSSSWFYIGWHSRDRADRRRTARDLIGRDEFGTPYYRKPW